MKLQKRMNICFKPEVKKILQKLGVVLQVKKYAQRASLRRSQAHVAEG
jgi:hypothetical protein